MAIADFGVAALMDEDNSLTTRCGSPAYASPELLSKKTYGKPTDIWSLGIMTFSMLVGYHPFHYCSDIPDLIDSITKGKYSTEKRFWSKISIEGNYPIVHW